jgi:hypothetical protein
VQPRGEHVLRVIPGNVRLRSPKGP